MELTKGVLFAPLSLLLFLFLVPASGRALLPRKPDPNDAAATARWLVSQNSWGVISTISIERGGAPFGNVVSFSDGLPGEGRGIPYFYLTTLDPTARDALKDERSSFTVSEFPIGTCGTIDPENPTCAKLTLNGKLKLVDSQSAEAEFARHILFSKHAEMKDWPEDHNFQVFKLDIEDIFLIDWFGGAKPLSPAQYLDPENMGFFMSQEPTSLNFLDVNYLIYQIQKKPGSLLTCSWTSNGHNIPLYTTFGQKAGLYSVYYYVTKHLSSKPTLGG